MSKFNCPICHKEFDTKSCVVEDIITKSEHVSSTVKGRKAVHTYRDTHYFVRHCKKCVKKKKITSIIVNTLIMVPLTIWSFLVAWNSDSFIVNLFLSAVVLLIVYALGCGLIKLIIYKLFFEPDIDYAREHNALE